MPRKFLVVVDDSPEFDAALRYACRRARSTGGRVALLRVIPPGTDQHWSGVREEIERQQRHENTAIAEGFDFAAVRGLSAEVLQKLDRVRPQTIGQAQRIPGMTPAAISLLLVHLERARRGKVA